MGDIPPAWAAYPLSDPCRISPDARVARQNRRMRAAVIDRFGGPEQLRTTQDAPRPQVGEGDVLVRVLTAGVNPLDYKIRDGSSGMCARLRDEDFPLILGRECCGVVEEIGSGVEGFFVGDRVFGMAPLTHKGSCYAEFAALPAESLAHAPAGVDDAVLGGLALVGLTAWVAVHDLARVTSDDVVLVQGGGGGVGYVAAQLAAATGAQVYATASARHADRLAAAGITHVDYTAQDYRDATPRPTVIIDGVYFGTYPAELDHLADGGRIVLLPSLADLGPAKERDIPAFIPTISPDRARLDALAARVADGSLRFDVADTLPLEQVADAHRALESAHAPGKLVLRVAD